MERNPLINSRLSYFLQPFLIRLQMGCKIIFIFMCFPDIFCLAFQENNIAPITHISAYFNSTLHYYKILNRDKKESCPNLEQLSLKY